MNNLNYQKTYEQIGRFVQAKATHITEIFDTRFRETVLAWQQWHSVSVKIFNLSIYPLIIKGTIVGRRNYGKTVL